MVNVIAITPLGDPVAHDRQPGPQESLITQSRHMRQLIRYRERLRSRRQVRVVLHEGSSERLSL